MLQIADILNSDARYPEAQALPDILGDRYLYSRNKIFKAIRDSVLNFGYKFSKEHTQQWIDYQVFPLLSLQGFFDSKVIPYIDNGLCAALLVRKIPTIALEPKFLLDSMKKNYLLHESTHCVAHEFLKNRDVLHSIYPSDKIGRAHV